MASIAPEVVKAPQTHRFSWNETGRLTQASTGYSTVDFVWNEAGRLIAETQSTIDGFSQTLRYDYDPLGYRNRLTLPGEMALDTLYYGSGHWHQLACNGTPLVDVERDALHRETLRRFGGFSRRQVSAAVVN